MQGAHNVFLVNFGIMLRMQDDREYLIDEVEVGARPGHRVYATADGLCNLASALDQSVCCGSYAEIVLTCELLQRIKLVR